MAINEGDPIEDHGLYTGYGYTPFNRPGFARDIIFPGTRDLYNTDTLFNAQAYADRQIQPPDLAVTQQEWDTITEPGPPLSATSQAPAATTTTTTAAPKVSVAMIAVLALVALLVVRSK